MVKLSENALRKRTAVIAVLPEAAKVLETAWQRRRQELVQWQPTHEWIRVSARNPAGVRAS